MAMLRATRSRHFRPLPVAGLLAILLALATLAGCTGHSASTSSGASSAIGSVGDAPAGGAPVAGAAQGVAGSTADAAAAPKSDALTTTGQPVQTRDIVSTATITVQVADPRRAADRAVALASTLLGRVDSDVRNEGGAPADRTATVSLAVPTAKLSQALSALGALGVEKARNLTSTDVTSSHADIDARVLALQTSIARLRTFLSQAVHVSDLLAVETQLSSRQSDLESMQSQQRALGDQIALARVTATFSATAPPVVTAARHHGPAGFARALGSGWHGVVLAWRWFVAALGYLLPATIIVLLLGGAVVIATVQRRRARPAGAEVADGAGSLS